MSNKENKKFEDKKIKEIKVRVKCPNNQYCNEVVLIYINDVINCPNCGALIKVV